MYYGYLVGLFDILGFEEKFKAIGLSKMFGNYEALIDGVNYRQKQIERVFGGMAFDEAPYWTIEKDVFIFSKTHGAYASDSLLLWANRTWPEARDIKAEDFEKLLSEPSTGWKYHAIPCDNFLDVCNELICDSLEVGLPLRAALSMGPAILDEDKRIFLGEPIIDAARLEKGQKFIGAGLCKPFIKQTIPKRYLLKFDRHLKADLQNEWGGFVLDWPRHWRKTRKKDLRKIINDLNTNDKYSEYYENTLELISLSDKFSAQFESLEESSIRSVYSEFSFSNDNLSINSRAIRRVPIETKIAPWKYY